MQDRTGVRYRAEGIDLNGASCRVVVTAIRKTGGSPSEERSRALDMELDLLRRVEPAAAAPLQQSSSGGR